VVEAEAVNEPFDKPQVVSTTLDILIQELAEEMYMFNVALLFSVVAVGLPQLSFIDNMYSPAERFSIKTLPLVTVSVYCPDIGLVIG
jgi:hypothetical protein